jgi:hypothetical protein
MGGLVENGWMCVLSVMLSLVCCILASYVGMGLANQKKEGVGLEGETLLCWA